MIYSYLAIIPLLLASIEDLRKKAVNDIINYYMIIFTFSLMLYNFLKYNLLPQNILIGLFILLLYFAFYIIKAVAIGDLFIFLWLFYYISFFNYHQFIIFLISTFLSGFLIANIYSVYLFYKNKKDKQKFILAIISLLFSLIASSILIYFYMMLLTDIIYLIFSLILLLFAAFLFKTYEKDVKEMLKFIRKPSELIEGDWIEHGIIYGNLNEEALKKIEKDFIIKKETNRYIIKPKRKLLFGDKGLSKDQIKLLNEINNKNNVELIVQEGFPFVPAIFIGYLIAILL